MEKDQVIPVTKSFIPPKEEIYTFLDRAFDNQWLTNRGELVRELETKLIDYLDSTHTIMMANGTLPIQIALKLLGKGGEVITTPFSYVATTSAIVWEGCTPVYVDIHPDTFTINEELIENAITDNTTCILATHVFGNPCNVEAIQKIADKHGLKVIYDAAHAFGVKYKGESIFNYGDISTCSYHATKIFHTAEGGGIFSKDKVLLDKIFKAHNFGHISQEDFDSVGINAKMSEIQASLGLAVLPYMDNIINQRRQLWERYFESLNHDILTPIKIVDDCQYNYSYFPVLFRNEEVLLQVKAELEAKQIYPRRYFYPSLNDLPYITNSKMPVSEDIASKILCLPLYVGLSESDIDRILKIVNYESE